MYRRSNTAKSDRLFVLVAGLIWLAGLAVTAWDFVCLQGAVFRFGLVNGLGAGLIAAGLAIRLTARRTLGRQFSWRLRTIESHRLIRHGIYARIRHPAYTGDLLFWFGAALLFSSAYGLLVLLALIPCFVYRAGIEEKMLLDRFGDEYRDYMRTTRRFLPFPVRPRG